MNKTIIKDILTILQKSLHAIKENNTIELTNISNEINHNASIFQDEDSVTIAILIYSLSKLFYREKHIDHSYTKDLKKAFHRLSTRDTEGYRRIVKRMMRRVKQTDEKLDFYVTDVLDKAGLKKGTKMYYNGISLPRVAQLMGVSQWELVSYLGKTNIADTFEKTPRLLTRLEYARRLFK